MITWSAALVAVILARRVVAWVANETRHPDLRGG
jgi:hypothetical protein